MEKATAIVLRKFEFGDSSLILHLLTRHAGIIPALAKGANRLKNPFFATLDIPAIVEISYRSRGAGEVALLTEARLVEVFFGLRKSLDSYCLALYALELLEEAGQPSGSEALFDLASDFFSTLNRDLGQNQVLRIAFELKFLGLVGICPALEECASCGKTIASEKWCHFSPAAGGALCASCSVQAPKAHKLPQAALHVASQVGAAPWTQVPRLRLDPKLEGQIRRALDLFIQYHWERLPKTYSLLSLQDK